LWILFFKVLALAGELFYYARFEFRFPVFEQMKKIVKIPIGIICIILGFLALITPATPGSWLILIGLEILGLGFLLEGRLARFLKGKNKERFESFIKKLRQKLRRRPCEAKQKDEKLKSA
jgi:hypothetical protein